MSSYSPYYIYAPRWLRQPLTDVAAIVVRQDVVEVMLACTVLRNKLVEVSLKSVPDVDAIIRKYVY